MKYFAELNTAMTKCGDSVIIEADSIEEAEEVAEAETISLAGCFGYEKAWKEDYLVNEEDEDDTCPIEYTVVLYNPEEHG